LNVGQSAQNKRCSRQPFGALVAPVVRSSTDLEAVPLRQAAVEAPGNIQSRYSGGAHLDVAARDRLSRVLDVSVLAIGGIPDP
jgi:hypothetical protein